MRLLTFLVVIWAGSAAADTPVVTAVNASPSGDRWRFDVTVRHADTGWDHYADGWGVFDAEGAELGFRKLLHPHVKEQPFTRSLAGVELPSGTAEVWVKAHDLVHGWGDAVLVPLPN